MTFGANTLISENNIIGKIIDGKMIKPVSEYKFYQLEDKTMDIVSSIHNEFP